MPFVLLMVKGVLSDLSRPEDQGVVVGTNLGRQNLWREYIR